MVYFNDGIESNGFTSFKSMLNIMPIEFLVQLEKIFLLKPSFKNKAEGLLSFGTVVRFINSKICYFEGLEELCENLGFKMEDLHGFLPSRVREIYIDRDEEERIASLKKMLSTTDTKKSAKEDAKEEITSYVKERVKVGLGGKRSARVVRHADLLLQAPQGGTQRRGTVPQEREHR